MQNKINPPFLLNHYITKQFNLMKTTKLFLLQSLLLCACTDNIQLSEPSIFNESENSKLSSEKSIAVFVNSDFGAQYYDSVMSTEK